MRIKDALQILELDEYDISNISEMELKQQYRKFALMYHPDKNSSNDASFRFLEIKEAYNLLQTHLRDSVTEDTLNDDDIIDESNYHKILKEYLGIQIVDDKIHDILDNIFFVCEKQALIILEKIEGKKFYMMYSILKKYKHVFFLSDDFYQQIEEIYERKNKKEVIELHPTLNDLLNNMVYILNKNNEKYLVPLWHHELIYQDKNTDEEFIVRCIPDLIVENENENDVKDFSIQNNNIQKYWIDDGNHLNGLIYYPISYILEKSTKKEKIEVIFGNNKSLCFNPWELNIIPSQTIRWKKEGICIPTSEIHDVSKKSDILLHIQLY
jgi:hypothetical protein